MSGLAATVLLIALLPLALSGCGGSGGNESESGPRTPSGQPAAGGEKSIEGFGSEAKGADRKAILAAEQSYFAAVSSKDYGAACARLESSVKRSMAELAAGQQYRATCAAVLPVLLAPQAYAAMRQQARGVVKKVRIEDSQAFIVFHAPGARLYQMPLTSERGQWRVGLLAASVLAPSPSTLHG